jgi:DNA-binding beta-propeller fold protein YncE
LGTRHRRRSNAYDHRVAGSQHDHHDERGVGDDQLPGKKDGSIAIVDVATKKVAQKLDAKIQGANRLKFTPDGKWVLVSLLRGGDLTVFDAAAHAESKRIAVGAFVACSPDGYVARIDLRTMAVAGKFPAGNDPDGVAWVAPAR